MRDAILIANVGIETTIKSITSIPNIDNNLVWRRNGKGVVRRSHNFVAMCLGKRNQSRKIKQVVCSSIIVDFILK